MAKRSSTPTVLHVDGPVVIDWGNGVRIQLSPVGVQADQTGPVAPRVRAGRPPSPATAKLRETMEADAAAGGPRGRPEYLKILHAAGGPKSSNAAGIIVNREAKRAFGKPLGRGKKGRAKRGKGRRGGGRQ